MGFFESIEGFFNKAEGWLESMYEKGWIWVIVILFFVLVIVVMFTK